MCCLVLSPGMSTIRSFRSFCSLRLFWHLHKGSIEYRNAPSAFLQAVVPLHSLYQFTCNLSFHSVGLSHSFLPARFGVQFPMCFSSVPSSVWFFENQLPTPYTFCALAVCGSWLQDTSHYTVCQGTACIL